MLNLWPKKQLSWFVLCYVHMMMRHANKGSQWPMAIISHALTLDGLSHVCIHGCMHARINGEKYIYIYPRFGILSCSINFSLPTGYWAPTMMSSTGCTAMVLWILSHIACSMHKGFVLIIPLLESGCLNYRAFKGMGAAP